MELLRQIRDFNPDVSEAVDNFVTLSNPGYSLEVYYANVEGDDGKAVPDPDGLRLAQDFAVRMFSEYSGAWDETTGGKANGYPGLDAFIAQTHLAAATYGAMAAEVELTPALNDIVDVYPVDPTLIDFQADSFGRLVPGLAMLGSFKPLDPVRFRYAPLSPDIGQPGGRPPLLAALNVVMFQEQFLREIQAIAHMSNSPRLDVKLVEEAVLKAVEATRPDLKAPGKENELRQFMDAYIGEIQSEIASLEPDDVFVHYDSVEPTYVNPGRTAIPVGDILAVTDRAIISATKQLPLLLGRNEGATTTHATVQWQVYIEKLKSFQRISQTLATWALNLYLRIQGRPSYAVLEYNAHKTSDELVDAQAFETKARAWKAIQDAGWATADEAAMALLSHPANGTPAPVPVPQVAPGLIGLMAPSGERHAHTATKAPAQAQTRATHADGAGQDTPDEMPPVTEAEADAAFQLWEQLPPLDELQAQIDEPVSLDALVTLIFGARSAASVASIWISAASSGNGHHAHLPASLRRDPGLFRTLQEKLEYARTLLAIWERRASLLMQRFYAGETELGEWQASMRDFLRTANKLQLITGAGGDRSQVDNEDWLRLGPELQKQYRHLADFAQELEAGGLTEGQASVRAQMYARSTQASFWRQAMPVNLPAVPKDGSTECRTNCACSWAIEPEYDAEGNLVAWNCTWTLGATDHCPTCEARANTWNPLRVEVAA